MGREILASVEDVQRYSEKELAEKLSEFDALISRLRAAPHVDPRERGRKLLELTAFRAAMEEEQRLRSTPTAGTRGAQIHGPRANGGFGSFGEQLRAVALAGMPGQAPDPRLFRAAATGLSETVPSDGGFLVQQDFNSTLLKEVIETGILAKRCREISISSSANGVKLNLFDETSRASTRFGGALGYWLAEADEKQKSKPKFRQAELQLKKLVGLCYASDELLQDAPLLGQVVATAMTGELRFRLDDAILNGTGAGQPLGILNAGCLVSVAKESGQAADTIVAQNVIKMYSRLLPGSDKTAVWLANRNCLPQLYTMSLSVGTGGAPIFMPAGGLSQSPYNLLLGLPVVVCEHCASLGDLGDIVLADLQGYLLATKGGIQSDMSIHVRFIHDESVFRFVLRVDGQPELASPLTPYKGGAEASVSHFVALAERA